jgi:hypothetical protein
MRMAASANDDGGTCSEDAINDVLSAFRALRAEVSLLTHKLLTCGVAASHPDPALSRTGAYAGKWDSPQAEEVRKLRDERDTLARRAEETRVQAVANIDRALAAKEGWKRCAADLASETARANRNESALSERTRRVEALEGVIGTAAPLAWVAMQDSDSARAWEIEAQAALSSSPEEKAPIVRQDCPRCLAFRDGTDFDQAATIPHAPECSTASPPSDSTRPPGPPSSPDRCRCGAVTLWRNPDPNASATDSLTGIRHTRKECSAAPAATPDPTTKETP